MLVPASVGEAAVPVSRGPGFAIRVALAATLALALWLGSAPTAFSAPRFAAIAVDAHSGKVLFSRGVDSVCHPASLTKIMTLYMLFQELKAGRVTRDTPFKISSYAASREPSKLGLRPGETIRVDDAIRAIVTKSANDIAAAIAENLAGSESAFAERMTRAARTIGMTRTTFRNASGLPHPQQVTTARDMATLGLRIQRDFPQYYGYFSLRSFTWKGRTHRNHNRLLGQFKGMDGIKTGYIRASGFNLVTSAERSGRRLVGVVLGGQSPVARNRYMASMLETQFGKASFARGGTIAAAAGDPPGYVRNQKAEDLTRRVASRGKAEVTDPKVTATDSIGQLALQKLESARQVAGEQLAAKRMADAKAMEKSAAQERTEQTKLEPKVEVGDLAAASMVPNPPAAKKDEGRTFASVIVDDAEAAELPAAESDIPAKTDNFASLAPDQVETQSAATSWNIQVGAFPSKNGAERRIEEARAFGLALLEGKPAFTMSVQKDGGLLYRARFSGFTEEAARNACKSLSAKGLSCFTLSPQG